MTPQDHYESWVRPLVIILTVPLAMFGAMIGLWAAGNPDARRRLAW
jgi:multidrug efflux pump subunit AcrB